MEAPQISPPVLRFGAFFPRPAGTAGAPSPRALARCGRMGPKGSKDSASEAEEAVSAPPTAAEPTPPGCPRCGLPVEHNSGEGAGAFYQCRSCKTYMSHTQLYSRVEPPMKAPAAAAPELRVDPGVEEEKHGQTDPPSREHEDVAHRNDFDDLHTPQTTSPNVSSDEEEVTSSRAASSVMDAVRSDSADAVRRAVQLCARAGRDPHAADGEGNTPCHIAARLGHDSCIRALVEGADANEIINKANSKGYTPCRVAAAGNHRSTIKALIELGADPNKASATGATPCYIAAQLGHNMCIHALAEGGADVNKANNNKWTPCHVAADSGQDRCIRALLKHGADANRAARDGRTPCDVAKAKCHWRCVRTLPSSSKQPPPPPARRALNPPSPRPTQEYILAAKSVRRAASTFRTFCDLSSS